MGSVVLVKDERFPRLQWPLWVVTRGFPGLARSVEIRTAKGLLRRPVQCLYHLEINDQIRDGVDTTAVGEQVRG